MPKVTLGIRATLCGDATGTVAVLIKTDIPKRLTCADRLISEALGIHLARPWNCWQVRAMRARQDLTAHTAPEAAAADLSVAAC